MRQVPLTQQHIDTIIHKAKNVYLNQSGNKRIFRPNKDSLPLETAAIDIAVEVDRPAWNPISGRIQMWEDLNGETWRVYGKRRAIECEIKSTYDASAQITDCSDHTIDNFLFTTLQIPKGWWKTDDQGLAIPSDKELRNPDNYKLWIIGCMTREQYSKLSTLVLAGQKLTRGYAAKSDGRSLEHRCLLPFPRFARKAKAVVK